MEAPSSSLRLSVFIYIYIKKSLFTYAREMSSASLMGLDLCGKLYYLRTLAINWVCHFASHVSRSSHARITDSSFPANALFLSFSICVANYPRAPRIPGLSVTQHVAAPEVQQKKLGSFSSDMYSFGMTICAIYNQGRPLIQANHSCSDYLKQLETVS